MRGGQRGERALRLLDGLMVVLFGLSVIVQLNDPDPVAWIAIYAAAAVVSFLSMRGRLAWPFAAAVALAAAGWAVSIAPRVVGIVPFREMFGAFEMQNVGIEESREMYGLLLIAAWMAVAAVRAARRARPARLA
jgi:hypothetical protein